MKRHSLGWLLLVGLACLVLAACSGGGSDYGGTAGPEDPGFVPGTGIGPPRFAYVVNRGSDNISGFNVDPVDGKLTTIAGAGSPWATGVQPVSIAVDADVKFAYVANSGSDNLSIYSIASTGALTSNVPGAPIATGVQPMSVAVDPLGRFVYVANNGGTISAYTRSANGSLTPVPGSPFASTGLRPVFVAVDPTGSFVYVVNAGTNASNGSISVFTIDTASSSGHNPGALVPRSTAVAGASPQSITLAYAGATSRLYAYVANFGADNVSAFSVNAVNGDLTPTSFPLVITTGGTAPTSIAVEPNGKFAYVTNLLLSPGNLAAYRITTTITNGGNLTALAGAAASTTLSGGGAYSVAADPSGNFIYALQSVTNQIAAFKINATTGALAAITPVGLFDTEAGTTSDGRFILVTK